MWHDLASRYSGNFLAELDMCSSIERPELDRIRSQSGRWDDPVAALLGLAITSNSDSTSINLRISTQLFRGRVKRMDANLFTSGTSGTQASRGSNQRSAKSWTGCAT